MKLKQATAQSRGHARRRATAAKTARRPPRACSAFLHPDRIRLGGGRGIRAAPVRALRNRSRAGAKPPLHKKRGSKSRAALFVALRFAFPAALFRRHRAASAASGSKSRAARRGKSYTCRPPLISLYGGQEKIKAQKFFSRTITQGDTPRHEKNFCPLARRFAALIFVPSPVPPKVRGRAASPPQKIKRRLFR